MKLRSPLFVIIVAVMALFAIVMEASQAHAQPLVWQTEYGTFNFNLATTETGLGYDAINKKTVAIASVPVYTLPHDILALQFGVDGAWPTGPANLIEPYVAAGHDILREIPVFADYKSAHLNVFGRLDTTNGRPGVGISGTYAFGGTVEPEQPLASAAPVMSITSRLSLIQGSYI